MARKGSFGTSLSPFGGLVSDLSVYSIGTSTPEPTPTPTPTPTPPPRWPLTTDDDGEHRPGYVLSEPPVQPTVAPEPGALPLPVIPHPAVPVVTYVEQPVYGRRPRED